MQAMGIPPSRTALVFLTTELYATSDWKPPAVGRGRGRGREESASRPARGAGCGQDDGSKGLLSCHGRGDQICRGSGGRGAVVDEAALRRVLSVRASYHIHIFRIQQLYLAVCSMVGFYTLAELIG